MLLWEAISGVAFTVSCVSRVSMFLVCSAGLLQPLVLGFVGIRSYFTLIVTFEAPKEVDVRVGATSKVPKETSFLMLEHFFAPTTL